MARKPKKNIDQQMMGDEPEVKHYDDDGDVAAAMNWYSYFNTPSKAAKWVFEYMTKTGYDKEDVAKVKRLPKNLFPVSFCAKCRMLNRGSTFEDSMMERIQKEIDSYVEKAQAEIDDKDIQDRKNPHELMQEKAREIIADIEERVDQFITTGKSNFAMYDWLVKNEIKPVYGKFISEKYQPWLEEINGAINKTDKDLVEAYSSYTKKDLQTQCGFFKVLVEDSARYYENEKNRNRKPRKAKTKSAAELVKNVNYKKDDSDYKIVSIDPSNIIGAKSLWVFNTKTRQLAVYHEADANGLSVKGTTMQNYDEKSSEMKRIRQNKVAGILKDVLGGGKIKLRKIMSGVNAKSETPNGRINKDTILLKAIT